MSRLRIYEGSIEAVLDTGEYDSGDYVQVSYDELADLVEQANFFRKLWQREQYTKCIHIGPPDPDHVCVDWIGDGVKYLEKHTNRPLHPCLGGKSPYSEFLPI